jgi:hypothetical protein
LILNATARGQAEAIIPFSVRQIAKANALFPNLALGVLARLNRLLPNADSKYAVQGRHMRLNPALQSAVALNERAADRNNQR